MTASDTRRCRAEGEHQSTARHRRDECPTVVDGQMVEISITRSAGKDKGVVIFIDTSFEPDASDGGPGLRVLINDDEAYVGKPYDFGGWCPAETKSIIVRLDDIPYRDAGLEDDLRLIRKFNDDEA